MTANKKTIPVLEFLDANSIRTLGTPKNPYAFPLLRVVPGAPFAAKP